MRVAHVRSGRLTEASAKPARKADVGHSRRLMEHHLLRQRRLARVGVSTDAEAASSVHLRLQIHHRDRNGRNSVGDHGLGEGIGAGWSSCVILGDVSDRQRLRRQAGVCACPFWSRPRAKCAQLLPSASPVRGSREWASCDSHALRTANRARLERLLHHTTQARALRGGRVKHRGRGTPKFNRMMCRSPLTMHK